MTRELDFSRLGDETILNKALPRMRYFAKTQSDQLVHYPVRPQNYLKELDRN